MKNSTWNYGETAKITILADVIKAQAVDVSHVNDLTKVGLVCLEVVQQISQRMSR